MQVDKNLFYSVCIFITIGIVFSLSLSVYTVLLFNTNNHLYFFIRQLIAGILSICIIWFLSRLNPDKCLKGICLTLFAVTIFLMSFMHFLPASIVTSVNGAARWINLGIIKFSPVEFFKIGFIYFLAFSFTRRIDGSKKNIKKEAITLLPYIGLFLIVVVLIAILQNDLGQVAVLGLVLLMMMLYSGTSFKLFGIAFGGIILALFLFIVTSDHRIKRVQSWWGGIQDVVLSYLSPETAAKLRVENVETPYQVGHSLNAINNGGFFGEGIGRGTFKLGFLSEVHTDFVLAGITEEIGFLGLSLIVALFYWILFRIFRIGSRSTNKVYYLFSLGIGFMFLFSFMINSYGISSISPVKGIAVPFLSYGGSQLIASSVAIGLILMVSKRSKP